MSHDVFEDRRQALEEQFFKKHNESLVQKMRESAQRSSSKDEIRSLTGIANESVLETLASLKLGGAATLVMSLYPMIEVAWADGTIDERERSTILHVAEGIGLAAGTPPHAYLTQWLDQKPEHSWHTLWFDYVRELGLKMSAENKDALKASILGRARVVAEASGGMLGMLWNVSKAEQRVLDKLEQAFL